MLRRGQRLFFFHPVLYPPEEVSPPKSRLFQDAVKEGAFLLDRRQGQLYQVVQHEVVAVSPQCSPYLDFAVGQKFSVVLLRYDFFPGAFFAWPSSF